jgi:hypothetical protein
MGSKCEVREWEWARRGSGGEWHCGVWRRVVRGRVSWLPGVRSGSGSGSDSGIRNAERRAPTGVAVLLKRKTENGASPCPCPTPARPSAQAPKPKGRGGGGGGCRMHSNWQLATAGGGRGGCCRLLLCTVHCALYTARSTKYKLQPRAGGDGRGARVDVGFGFGDGEEGEPRCWHCRPRGVMCTCYVLLLPTAALSARYVCCMPICLSAIDLVLSRPLVLVQLSVPSPR